MKWVTRGMYRQRRAFIKGLAGALMGHETGHWGHYGMQDADGALIGALLRQSKWLPLGLAGQSQAGACSICSLCLSAAVSQSRSQDAPPRRRPLTTSTTEYGAEQCHAPCGSAYHGWREVRPAPYESVV